MSEFYKRVKSYLPYCLAIFSGAIMTYGFAPYDIGLAPMLSCALFLCALKKQRTLNAFFIGWLYGLGMFGAGVSWIYVSIHDYGNAPPPLAFVITLIFVMGMALYPAILAALLNRVFPTNGAARCIFAFPALWVIFEMLRGWVLTGFPWLYVGYCEMGNRLSAFAPVGGVWLVSWMTVLFASLCYLLLDYFYEHMNKAWLRNTIFVGILSVWAAAFVLHQITWNKPTQHTLKVALVQGNIPQLMRWDPQHVRNILKTYAALTHDALQNALIVWPEGAIPLSLPHSLPFFASLEPLLHAHHIGLIAGVPEETQDGKYYYNALTTAGSANGIYRKEHLVPFGEYVPLENWLRGLIGFFDLPMSSMIPGPTNQGPLTAHGYTFAPAICYEIAYPDYVQKMSKETQFILTVSNDAWFGRSIGPAQHLQIAQFRALETGKYVLRATNTGYTAIIDPNGNIQQISPAFEKNILTGNINVMSGQTPWSKWGSQPVLAALVLILGLAYWRRPKK